MSADQTDFAETFARPEAAGQPEETVAIGGANARTVSVAG